MNSPDANFINREDKIVESSFEMKDYINKFYQLMMILFGRKPTIAPLTLRDAETKENDILVKRTEEINQLVEEINDLVEKYSEENDLKKKEIWEDKFLEKAKEAIELIYLGDKAGELR